ncbi:MAG: hypothetical protein ACREQZ_12515 [Woeseiaceae bacterium]
MAISREPRPLAGAAAAHQETELTMDAEDEFEYGDFTEREDVSAAKIDDAEPEADHARVPLWRLIEMSREDRYLKMELADFEDYDDSLNAGSDRAAGNSR